MIPRGTVQRMDFSGPFAKVWHRTRTPAGEWGWSEHGADAHIFPTIDDAWAHAGELGRGGVRHCCGFVLSADEAHAIERVQRVARPAVEPHHVEPEEAFADLERRHLA